jgi:Bacterial DNA-binding protein
MLQRPEQTDERLAASTELSKKEVGRVLDALGVLIERQIGKRSVGTFTLPGLLRVKVVQTPARPARKGVPNPFRPGETMDVAAKPARPQGESPTAQQAQGDDRVSAPTRRSQAVSGVGLGMPL